MLNWIKENTSITSEEYERVMGNLEVIKQRIEDKGCYTSEEIDRKMALIKKNKYRHLLPTRTDIYLKHIEKFANLYKGFWIYDLFLSHRMNIDSDKKDWIYEGIHFDVLSDYFEQYDDILLRADKLKFDYFYTIVLAGCFSNSTIVIGNMHDLDGGVCLHSFIIVKDKVYDYSKNLVMDKDLYYKLYDVKEVSKMSTPEFLTYHEEYCILKEGLGANITTKEFLCWPKEILNGLRKEQKRILTK